MDVWFIQEFNHYGSLVIIGSLKPLLLAALPRDVLSKFDVLLLYETPTHTRNSLKIRGDLELSH